jgi:hypothetical protein
MGNSSYKSQSLSARAERASNPALFSSTDRIGFVRPKILNMRQLSRYLSIPEKELYVIADSRDETGFPVCKVRGRWQADAVQVEDWLLQCFERGDRPLKALRSRRATSQGSKKKTLMN